MPGGDALPTVLSWPELGIVGALLSTVLLVVRYFVMELRNARTDLKAVLAAIQERHDTHFQHLTTCIDKNTEVLGAVKESLRGVNEVVARATAVLGEREHVPGG